MTNVSGIEIECTHLAKLFIKEIIPRQIIAIVNNITIAKTGRYSLNSKTSKSVKMTGFRYSTFTVTENVRMLLTKSILTFTKIETYLCLYIYFDRITLQVYS